MTASPPPPTSAPPRSTRESERGMGTGPPAERACGQDRGGATTPTTGRSLPAAGGSAHDVGSSSVPRTGRGRSRGRDGPAARRRCAVSMSAPIARTGREDERSRADAPGDDGEPPGRDVVVGVDGSEVGWVRCGGPRGRPPARGTALRIVHAAPYLGAPGSRRAPVAGAAARAADHRHGLHRRPARRARACSATTEVVPGDPVDRPAAAAAARPSCSSSAAPPPARPTRWCSPRWPQRVAARSPRRSSSSRAAAAGRPEDRPGRGRPRCRATGRRRGGRRIRRRDGAAVRRAAVGAPDPTARAGGRLSTTSRGPSGSPASRASAPSCPTPGVATARRGLPHPPAGDQRRPRRSACTAPLDGPHRWLLRHCTSPMALVPEVHRPTGTTAGPSPAADGR